MMSGRGCQRVALPRTGFQHPVNEKPTGGIITIDPLVLQRVICVYRYINLYPIRSQRVLPISVLLSTHHLREVLKHTHQS
jgi:hypothetical protein